jgi:PAS domain S-box-containing protein
MMLNRMEEAEALSQMGNWELNLITGKRYWSRGMYRLMEYDYEQHKDQTLSLLSMVVDEDKDRLNKLLHSAVNDEHIVPVSEFQVVTNNGNKRDVLVRTQRRFNSKGQLTTIYGSIRDITEKKEQDRLIAESEAKYRTLVENSAQMTYTADVEGAYTYASVHLKKTIGYTDEEILGKKFAFIDGEEWRKKTIGFYVNQLQNNIDETKFVFPIISKTGAKLWVEQTAWLVREQNTVTGFRCVLHDITEQVKTSEAMEEAMRHAEEAREMQQNFLGRMSHEIRTPMNGVVGMVNLLGDTALSGKQRIYTDSIKESAQNMLRIINDILDISKIESGKLVFEETEIDLAQIVNNVIFTLKPAADEKRLLIASHIDNKVPAKLVADPVRLNQILLNLTGNAIKFTERGSVIVSVSQAAETSEQITLEFKVTDTGIGIAKDKLASVFESFTQAESDTTRKYGGTGLGLTIARQLVEQQGGTIIVESEQGHGTTFTFTFHFKPANDAATLSGLPENVNIHLLNGVNVLLVEDNIMNQKVAKFTLENWGINVAIADRGYKAIDLLKANTYDLILMDLQMPEMNGVQTTMKIRQELLNNTPIMAMTASAMNMEREKCINAGMNDYISKPFEPEELNQKIYNLLCKDTDKYGGQVINMTAVREITNNDIAFIKDIFSIYVDRTPDILDSIEKYIVNNEHQLLHGELHNLKNSIGILGAKELYEMLAGAETDTTDKAPSDDTILLLRTTIKSLVLQSIEEAKEKINTL